MKEFPCAKFPCKVKRLGPLESRLPRQMMAVDKNEKYLAVLVLRGLMRPHLAQSLTL